MATVIVANDVLRGVVATWSPGQVGLNDFAWVVQGLTGSGPFTLQELVGVMDTQAATAYTAYLASDASFYGISLKRVLPTPTQPVFTANLRPGTNGSITTPKQSAGVITRQTATGGRAGRGRIYIPFISSDDITFQGELSSTGVTNITAVGTTLMTLHSFTTGGGNSYQLRPVLITRLVPGGIDLVDFIARVKIANQRRRGDYGRPNSLPW